MARVAALLGLLAGAAGTTLPSSFSVTDAQSGDTRTEADYSGDGTHEIVCGASRVLSHYSPPSLRIAPTRSDDVRFLPLELRQLPSQRAVPRRHLAWRIFRSRRQVCDREP